MIHKNIKGHKGSITTHNTTEGETIEMRMRRILNNKEPITDGAPIVYMERKEGINPGYNVRTDRFEIALDGMDKVTKNKALKREERQMPKSDKTDIKSTESTPGTDNGNQPAA